MSSALALPLAAGAGGLLLLVTLTCAWQWWRADRQAQDWEGEAERWRELFQRETAERRLATDQLAQVAMFQAATTGPSSVQAATSEPPQRWTLASLVEDAAHDAHEAWRSSLDSAAVPVVPVETLFDPATAPVPTAPVMLPPMRHSTFTREELEAAIESHEEWGLPWDEVAASLDVPTGLLRREVDTFRASGVV